VLGLLLCVVISASAAAVQPTALAVEAASPARYVYGSDGRTHVDYDLIITNAFTAPVTLDSLRVRGGGKTLLTLRGRALAAHTFQTLGSEPTAIIPVSSTVKTLVDVALPRSAGRTVPRRLSNRIRYALPADAPLGAAIGSRIVRAPVLRVERRAPVPIASPLRGSGWLAANGCCADPTSPHRTVLLPANGTYTTPEIFAIDWIRVRNGVFFNGDGTRLGDWPGTYGVPIRAVADGVVVTAANDYPDIPPLMTSNPALRKPGDFAGNNVVQRIGRRRYAVYAHMKTGSVRVRRGQRLRTGQVIGLLGNSGNTTGPHLHFGIYDGPDPLTSNSVPFQFNQFRFQGTAGPGATPNAVTLTGKPRRVRQAEPLINAVTKFSR
jgi:hypothetical protein